MILTEGKFPFQLRHRFFRRFQNGFGVRFPAAEDVLPEDRVLRDAQPIEDNDSDEEQQDPYFFLNQEAEEAV